MFEVNIIFYLVSIPNNSWFSSRSISNQLISYRQSISCYDEDHHTASFDWNIVLHRHVIPFWSRINRRDAVWISMDTLRSASLSMRAVKHLTKDLESSYALIRSTRYHILMAHCLAWSWLESICAYHSQPHIAKDPLSNSWPYKLARYLYMVFETRLPTFTLCPSDYIPHLSSDPQTFRSIGFNEYTISDYVPILQQRVYLQMKRILQRWLDFSLDDMADSQAWLVQNFISVFGPGSLLLDETWDVYQHVPRHVLGRQRNRTHSIFLHQLVPFFYHIRNCEAASNDSSARTLLDQYHQEFTMNNSRQQQVTPSICDVPEVTDSFQERLQDEEGYMYCVNNLAELSEEVMDVDMFHGPLEDVSLLTIPT